MDERRFANEREQIGRFYVIDDTGLDSPASQAFHAHELLSEEFEGRVLYLRRKT